MATDTNTSRSALADLAAERDDVELAAFVAHYYHEVPDAVLVGSRPDDLFGACLAHRELLDRRRSDDPAVRVFNPSYEVDGWTSATSVVHVVATDSPFIVDSVTLAVERAGCSLHRAIHPVLVDDDGTAHSLVSIEFDRITDTERLEEIGADIERTLVQVAMAVADWRAMLDEADQVAKTLAAVGEDRHDEAAALFDWLVDDNFIFLGYRRYELLGSEPAELILRSVRGSGLGILAQEPGAAATSVRLAELPAEIGARAVSLDPLHVTKTNGRSLVHRNARMDYIGVKIVTDGAVVGEHRFLGLLTASSYRRAPGEVPVIRKLMADTVKASGYTPGSHNASELLATIDRYPRDELFQMEPAELLETSRAIVHLGRRRDVALFARSEPFGRFVSCLVLLPRDQLTTALRRRIEALLVAAFDGTEVDYTTQVTESAHAQLHYVIAHPPGTSLPDMEELRSAIDLAAHNWADDLRDALCDAFGDDRGGQLHRLYGTAFGPAYEARYSTRAAVSDIRRFEAAGDDELGLELVRPLGAAPGCFQLRLHRNDVELRLSEMMPYLHNLGAEVVEEQPHEIERADGRTIYLYDFSLEMPADDDADVEDLKARFEEALLRAWRGEIESDGFNRLVLRAGLSWRQVRLIQAYAAYFRQIGARFSSTYVGDTMVNYRHITRDLVDLFTCRFEPDVGDLDDDEREARCAGVLDRLDDAIEEVVELDEDRIVRALRDLVMATVRTNYFQHIAGHSKPYLTLKFDPASVPDLAPPFPAFETFVFSARTEGIHLRSGVVSRGGIRWSTRLEDYRTEVLGLMNTQVAKNAIIVPTGAKGGFIAKHLHPSDDRATVAAEVEACYRLFITGLLDITDNLVDGAEVRPPAVVAHDEDGAYLVVAADKGTATFSDVANNIALERGFWLGDAFASGGSAGYDHKAMGITARGAWESVSRHFRQLDLDVARDRFTVVGVGDMSGDVFGNGMLLSRQIALVGAFDHRHVFVDPDPDTELGWHERKRLFELPGSSWDDYDRDLLSPGGAVYQRNAKSIEPSAEIRSVLRIPDGIETLTPNELIQWLLRSPVQMLWNGGIGTFVKASSETHLNAADKANDAIRVDAGELGCQVVGEGGNLGLTQRARIELALNGGRVMTDAIDNAAGVATSDIEVNVKILLDAAVTDGDLTTKQRDELLAEMTDDVAELVLAANYSQGRAVENALAEGFEMVDVHERLIAELVGRGLIDRRVEPLPDADALAERRARGMGLASPEIAVLLTQMKNALTSELAESDLATDPLLDSVMADYFPPSLRALFPERITGHSLRRELVATTVANRVVDRGGITIVMRLADETGATWVDVARAHTVAWELFAMDEVWAEIAALDNQVSAQVQTWLLLRGRRLVERSTRWLLRRRRQPIDMAAAIAHYGPHIDQARELIESALSPAQRETMALQAAALMQAGVPEGLARRSIGYDRMARSLDIIEAARVLDRDLGDAATLWFDLEAHLGLGWLGESISALPRAQRWESLARSALRDELSQTHAELAATVLRHFEASGDSTGAGAGAGAGASESASVGASGSVLVGAVDRWLADNGSAAGRLDALRVAVQAELEPGLEPITVVLRELRGMAGS